MRLLKVFSFLWLGFCCQYANAAYRGNITGKVVSLITYPSGVILFKLENQPASYFTGTDCGTNVAAYFSIDLSTPERAMDRMYARILAAHGTQTPITIGYDTVSADCTNGYIKALRVG